MADAGRLEGVSREDVIWAYRLLLGREPEDEDSIRAQQTAPDRRDLVERFLDSAEFHAVRAGVKVRGVGSQRFGGALQIETDADPERLAVLVERVAQTWRGLGETRPHWSVLTHDRFLPENLEAQKRAFFQSGAASSGHLLHMLNHVGREPSEFETVTEYGCGLGRVSNHLAQHFKRVIGCDISASHLEIARAETLSQGLKNITYREITAPDFGMTEPIDLWFSHIVLQHNPPPIMTAILRRMLRRLRPGGLAIFQLPTHRPGYSFTVADYLASPSTGEIEMHILPLPAVIKTAHQEGAEVLEIFDDSSCGEGFSSNFFVLGK